MSNPKHFIITVGDFRDSRGRFFSLRTPFHRPLNRALYRIGASWDKEIKCWLLGYSKKNWARWMEHHVCLVSLPYVLDYWNSDLFKNPKNLNALQQRI